MCSDEHFKLSELIVISRYGGKQLLRKVCFAPKRYNEKLLGKVSFAPKKYKKQLLRKVSK